MSRRCEIMLSGLIALAVLSTASGQDGLPPIVPSSGIQFEVDDPSRPTPWVQPRPSAEPDVLSTGPVTMMLTPSDSASAVQASTFAAPQAAADSAVSPLSSTLPTRNVLLPGNGIPSGMSSPFSQDKMIEPPAIDQNYDRVLDLFPDANDRQLIERVREAVEQTEIGEDVTAEEWITVRGAGKRITWGGRIETDSVNWARDGAFGGQPNYVEFRRLRLMASGEGYGIYDYQLELEFAPGTDEIRIGDTPDLGLEVKDAYIGVREVPWLGYTVLGHFRTPIGLSSLTSTRFIPFMERSLPNRLLPGRELGLAAFNRAPELNMAWGYGIFFDDLDEARRRIENDNQGTSFIGRVTGTPYFDEESDGACLLHLGLGYAYTRPRLRDAEDDMLDPIRAVEFRARPEIARGDPLISTGLLDAEHTQILNGEMAWAHGPLTLQAEATYMNLDLAELPTSNLWGTYVYGSWFLTGERRPYDRNFGVFRRVTPYENFWMVPTPNGTEAGLGAWELAVRWSHLNFTDISDQYLNDLTVGMNWYWNPHSRVMFNWIHPFAHNSPLASEVDADGDIIALRMQIDF